MERGTNNTQARNEHKNRVTRSIMFSQRAELVLLQCGCVVSLTLFRMGYFGDIWPGGSCTKRHQT